MARGTKRDGFNIDSIVNTKTPEVGKKDAATTKGSAAKVEKSEGASAIKEHQPAVPDKPAIIETTPEREKRYQKLIYLNKEQRDKLNKYGKKIGKAAGGASRIISDALDEYFNRHSIQ